MHDELSLQLHKFLWKKNLDALKRIEREKVKVTSGDVGCMAAYREFEEFVVL